MKLVLRIFVLLLLALAGLGVWAVLEVRRESRDAIPVLTYHYFRSPEFPSPAVSPGQAKYYIVTGEEFEQQLEYLEKAGYHPVSFTRLMQARSLRDLPPRPMVITVDHEAMDRLQIAVPALLRHHMTATFFVVTNWIGRPGNLTAANLRTMSDWGMDVESHTRNHPSLTQVSRGVVASEMLNSRRDLEAITGKPVLTMSPPGGKWDSVTVEEARRAGYLGFRTTDPGWAHVGDYVSPGITLPGSLSQREFGRLLSPSGIGTLMAANVVMRTARATLGPRYAGLRAFILRHHYDRIILSPTGRMQILTWGLVLIGLLLLLLLLGRRRA